MIAVRGLSFTYAGAGTPALDGVSFDVERGEFVAAIGANGAGKSSLCCALAGFIPHFYRGEYRGSVQIAGMESAATPLAVLTRKIGLVLQNPLNQISGARVTVAEEVAFGLENLGVARAEMRARVETVLQQFAIADLAERSPLALSGGQQQKVALAAILAMRPEVLVLDEPAAQLDAGSAEDIFRLLKRLCAEGLTVFVAEHRVDLIAAYADRALALANGRLLLDGAPAQVLADPRLAEQGIPVPLVTRLARRAGEAGLWQAGRALPVGLEEAINGFRGRGDGD